MNQPHAAIAICEPYACPYAGPSCTNAICKLHPCPFITCRTLLHNHHLQAPPMPSVLMQDPPAPRQEPGHQDCRPGTANACPEILSNPPLTSKHHSPGSSCGPLDSTVPQQATATAYTARSANCMWHDTAGIIQAGSRCRHAGQLPINQQAGTRWPHTMLRIHSSCHTCCPADITVSLPKLSPRCPACCQAVSSALPSSLQHACPAVAGAKTAPGCHGRCHAAQSARCRW